MDGEELYDSLEEEFSSASSTSIILLKPVLEYKASSESSNDFPDSTANSATDVKRVKELSRKNSEQLLKNQPNSKYTKSATHRDKNGDISSIVPLYDGDCSRSEVETFKKCSSSCQLSQDKFENSAKFCHTSNKTSDFSKKNSSKKGRSRSIFTTHQCVPKGYSSLETIVQDHPRRSYLDMFKVRFFKKKEMEDTVRSLFGDSHRSAISEATTENTEFEDASGYDSDTASCYFNQSEEKTKELATANLSNASTYNRNNVSTPSVVSSPPSSKFNSVSEVFTLSPQGRKMEKRKTRSRRTSVVPVPVLGGLGPDPVANQEKLERRKKQLNYGQRVSNRNRIKMAEIHALKSLKIEIQKSNSN